MPRAQASIAAPTPITSYPSVRPTRTNVRAARVLQNFEDEEDASVCPLCCEQLDETEKKHRPCPCGYQVCLFCLQRLQDEYGNRCPACRTVYGTDREEWERQAEARAQEARAKAELQRQKQSPKPLSETSPGSAEVSSSHAAFPPLDDGPDRTNPTVSAPEVCPPAFNQPGPSYTQPHEHADENDWPSLSQFQGARPTQAPIATGAAATPQVGGTDSGNTPSSLNTSACEGVVPRRPPGLPLPVTVQSVVNGTSASLDTVIDLGTSSDNLHTYVAKDLSPLIQRLKAMQSTEKTSKKNVATASASQKNPAGALNAISAAKRRPGPDPVSGYGAPEAPPGLPPGLERRTRAPATVVQNASAGLWPQPANDVTMHDDTHSTTFRSPSPASSLSTQGLDGLGAITATAPNPPPGLAPPPGLSTVAPAAIPVQRAPAQVSSTVIPAAAPAPTSNILHELFPREKSGRLGWFAAPAPAFEGNMHQLWDSSAPLSTLVHPTLSSTRSRRPLYARNADNVPPTITEEDGCGPPPGLERDSTRDPVVATLTRKLGGRAAEIGANVK